MTSFGGRELAVVAWGITIHDELSIIGGYFREHAYD
jgi:hypothetical protein